MGVMVILVCSLVAYPIIWGIVDSDDIEIQIELKNLSSPYYKFGLEFVRFELDDEEYIEEEFTIGLFIVNLVFIFYKKKNGA